MLASWEAGNVVCWACLKCGDVPLEKRRRPREYGMKGLVDQARIESTKIVSDEILQKVAEITGVSLEDLKTMEEPMSIYIENNSTNTIEKGANVGSVNSSYDENDNDFETTYHVNPIDKITELYERLLKADQEKIKELEQRIAELEGNASKS